MRFPRGLTLRAKLNLFVCLNALLGLVLVTLGFSYITIHNEYDQKQTQALQIAILVAQMPQVITAFRTRHPETVIQPIAERVRREVGAQFVVIANRNLVRYSHPNPSEVGKRMTGSDVKDDPYVLQGHTNVSLETGTLGVSLRGKAPIYTTAQHVIGFVSVGFLLHNLWVPIYLSLIKIVGISLGAFLLSLIGAQLLSGHVKRSIFGMEPSEIAYLVQEQSAILRSIQDGILSVDGRGNITACNPEAARILHLQTTDVLGKPIRSVIAHDRLCSMLEEGTISIEQPMILGTTMVIVHRVPVLLHDEYIGAVVTFRDQMALDQLDRRLVDIEQYAAALRSQRHEFMNRLHTISGLLQMQDYDAVRLLIDEVSGDQNALLSYFANRIRDPAVLAILIGKSHRANELGIRLHVDSASQLSEQCPHREVVITVLGNAIENALEALTVTSHLPSAAVVTVHIRDASDAVYVTVKDTGPGIDPQLGSRIFEDGISTKGPDRGFGLALCYRLVAQARGHIAVLSSTSGATMEMVLPRGN